MCRVLEVSVSGYYASMKRPSSWHALIDEVLLARVRVIHADSGETYGAPRIERELRAEGLPTSTKRVARLMREDDLEARPRNPYHGATTTADPRDPVAPNRLARQFTSAGLPINRVWVADITYIPTREGFLYLATLLDLASRRCVGWAMRDTLDGDLTVSALQMARAARQPAPGLIHHSDRGSQYTAAAYQAALATAGMVPSMSRKGDCYDNAVAESFFSTLEFELLMKNDWHSRSEARRGIFKYIETWYNRKRRHSTLGYVSPATYEEHLQAAA
jgi:transposase InsO family protein